MTKTLLIILILEFVVLSAVAFVEHKHWVALYFISAAVLNFAVMMMGE
jgi:hypothetical protein